MNVVYCDRCRDISIKSRVEKDVCNACGRAAQRVPYARPWQYYASSGLLLMAAAILILVPIADIVVRVAILAAFLIIALALASMSIKATRARILRRMREADVEVPP